MTTRDTKPEEREAVDLDELERLHHEVTANDPDDILIAFQNKVDAALPELLRRARERDEALATLALYRTNPAECVHCGDYDTSREHWRVCSEHPARAESAMLAEALRQVAITCPACNGYGEAGTAKVECFYCREARAALANTTKGTT